ncbi:MAG: hypothetical protein PUC82_02250, partial [bacterium]|nr:hypothetical protein [bacterium]
TITLQELQNRKYIGQVLDRSKSECTVGSVTIFKYSKDGYSYRPYLKCPKYETGADNYGENGPEITLNLNRNYANPSFSYEIVADGDSKIISYSYLIYKNEVLVRDSGSVEVSRVGKVDLKEVSLKDLVPGDFKIVFKATNVYGYSSTKTVSGVIKAENAPGCGEVSPVYTTADWRRYDPSVPIEVKVGCVDTNGSGCAKEIFSQLFNYDVGADYIEIVDNAGVKNTCSVGVYIDNTPPTKPVLTNPYEGVWTNKSYSITAVSKDETGGIAYYQYRYPNSLEPSEREWHTYANSSRAPKDATPFTTTPFSRERSEYVEIRACDYAGNCSEPAQSLVKIDTTAPTCSISRNIASPNGSNNWYVSNVVLNMATTDNTSGIVTAVKSPVSYELTTSLTPVYAKMNLSETQTDTKGVTWNGYIKDEAGNTSTCSSGKIKVDNVDPTCELKIETSGITFNSKKDETSGINVFDITKISTASYNNVSQVEFSNDTTFYGYVKDASGRVGACNAKTTSTKDEAYCSDSSYSLENGQCKKETQASETWLCSGGAGAVCDYYTSGATGSSQCSSHCSSYAGAEASYNSSNQKCTCTIYNKKTGYRCNSGTLSGSKCVETTNASNRKVCPSSYTKLNEDYCYLLG